MDNAYRITLRAWLDECGYLSLSDALEDGVLEDSSVPCLCRDGCEAEPDGRCEHGCPSVLLAAGLI